MVYPYPVYFSISSIEISRNNLYFDFTGDYKNFQGRGVETVKKLHKKSIKKDKKSIVCFAPFA